MILNKELATEPIFEVLCRSASLTRHWHKGSNFLERMKELQLEISAETHLNPVIEACMKSKKLEKAFEIC